MKFRGTHETPQEIGDMRHPSFVEGYWTLVIRNSVSFPGPAARDSVAKGGATLAGSINRGYSSMSPVFSPARSGLPQGDPAPGGVHSAESWEMGIMSPHLSPLVAFGRCISIGDHSLSLFSI